MVVAILTGHAPVRGNLYIMGLFNGNPAGWRLKQCSILSAAARRWLVSAIVSGKLTVEPKDISTASVRDLCLSIRGTGLLNMC